MENSKILPSIKPEDVIAKNFLLSLIIPCYNESARVEIMLQGLAEFEAVWARPYEVIIVDDGSEDDTARKIHEAIDTAYTFLKGKYRIEVMPANGGKGNALKRGVALAKGDFILTLDADMSTRPIELINWEMKDSAVFAGGDVIYIASRKHPEGYVEALTSRRVIGGVFNNIVQIFTTLHLSDTQCGFKLYPRRIAGFLFGNLQSKGWVHDVELLYQADLNGITIKEMPVRWINMPDSKVNVFIDSIKMFFGVLAIVFRTWLFNTFVLPFKIPSHATAAQRKHIISRSVFNILALLLVIVMPMMSFGFAITGDEHWHFDYGNSIYNYFFHGDTEAQTTTSGIQYYGGIFDFITGYVYNVFHFWDHYTTMHFINAIVGSIGIIYAAKLAKFFGDYTTGILAIIFLVLSPSWFGHNFANPKDIPFSVGYTAGVYYILVFLKALPAPSAKHIFGLICSIGWAMGVRIGGLLLIVYLAMFICIYSLYTRQFIDVLKGHVIRQVITVAFAGYLIAIICWPYAHMGIVSKPWEALKVMSNFFVNIGMLYEGKKVFSNLVPWYYIPKYILYTAPVIVLAGMAIGFPALAVVYRNNRKLLLLSLFMIFTIVFPLGYAIYKQSSLYDGWRHFLFIYPPLVVIASIGWGAVMNMGSRVVKYATILIIAAGLLLPVKYVIANHPYEVLYYNEIAGGLKNIYGKYETDYYMLSMKEATDWLVKTQHLDKNKAIIATNCSYPVIGRVYQLHCKNLPWKYDRIYERYSDFAHDDVYDEYESRYPDFRDNFASSVVYVKANELYVKDWDYCIVFSRFVDAAQINAGNWPPPETIYTVKVDGVPVAAVLKRKTKKDFAGFELMKEKRYDEAKIMFMESLQEYNNNIEVWEALARIYHDDDQLDSAIYAGYHVLAIDPGDIGTCQMMGIAYLKQHKADSAIKLYKALSKYAPGYSHFLLAYAYAATGNGNAALHQVDLTIELDRYNEQAYKLGMQIAEEMDDDIRAEDYYQKAKKAFPDDEDDQAQQDQEHGQQPDQQPDQVQPLDPLQQPDSGQLSPPEHGHKERLKEPKRKTER